MDYDITTIKDLVIQTLKNNSDIKAKADSGDALSCFQVGLVYLFGIDTPIDFKKAGKYFETQSLSEDPDANRLLGFIAECNGNYSQAFKNYANASKVDKPYFKNVSEERGNLHDQFKKLKFQSAVLNKEVSRILNDYTKGESPSLDAKIKLAYICEDEATCLDAAQAAYDAGNIFSAFCLLKKGEIADSNSLYASIKNSYSSLSKSQNSVNALEIIDLNDNSILTDEYSNSSYTGIKKLCTEASMACMQNWINIAAEKIDDIKQRYEKEESARLKKEKEAARIKKEKDDEAARRKKFKKEVIQVLVEKEKKKERRNRRIFYAFVILGAFFIGCYHGVEKGVGALIGGLSSIFVILVLYLLYKLIIKIFKK